MIELLALGVLIACGLALFSLITPLFSRRRRGARISSPRQAVGLSMWRQSMPWPITLVLLLGAIGVGTAALLRDPDGRVASSSTPSGVPAGGAQTNDVVFPAVADSYIDSAEPGTNISRTTKLRIDGEPQVVGLVQFDLRGFRRPVRDARLRLYSLSESSAGFQVKLARLGAWQEEDMTLPEANRRATGAVAFSGAFPEAAWASADVTPLLARAAGKIVTFALSTAAPTNISFASLDGGARAPQLVVRAGGAPAPVASPASGTPQVLAVGDIASCDGAGDEATGALLATNPDAEVLVLGDLAYESGSKDEFAECYAPSWGPAKERTYPVPGNHEYLTPGADGYFGYFGTRAGERSKGYYSFDVGDWHLVAINSNCSEIGGCGEGSPQLQWLREDLANHPARCTLAFWHHPRFSSGQHGGFASMEPTWQALQQAGAEIVLSGHDHDYERFAPQDASGAADSERGIRQFVVGTGGKSRRPFEAIVPNSEARSDSVYGVLRLSLHSDRYEWEFLPAEGSDFSDSGSAGCH